MPPVQKHDLGKGFADPVKDAQRVFRKIMDAMARPGLIQSAEVEVHPPRGIMVGTAALALALFDHDTPIWCDHALDHAEAAAWLRFHSGAPIVTDSASSSFALVGDPAALRGFDAFSVGSGDYPDGSTTIVMQLETLAEGRPLRLTGPGIKESATIAPSPLPEGFLNWLAANHASFPCGIDVILVAGANFAALPRTTTVKPMEA